MATAETMMWTSLLHAGLAGSFMRLPHVAADAEALRGHGAQAAVYGIRFDATNISRTGANSGPRATPVTSLIAGRIAVEAMAHHGGAGR